MSEKREQKLTQLADLMTDFFIEKAKNGDLTANEQKQVLQLLKDNGITIDKTQADPLAELVGDDMSILDGDENESYYTH